VSEPFAVGVSRPRPDSESKVRGTIRYEADRRHPGALHARPVLAPYAHARLLGVDAGEARRLPGVVAVLTAADLGLAPGTARVHQPLAVGEVLFAGQPVALVVAETPEAAADAAELVTARYESLPVVLDLEDAMAPESPLVRTITTGDDTDGPTMDAGTHAGVGGAGDASIEAERLSPNVTARTRYRQGDASAAMEASAVRVHRRFRTNWLYQGYLEPQACAAWTDDDGTVVVESSTQGIFGLRVDVAGALGLPVSGVRVVPAPLGGAFGGKWSLFETMIAAAAVLLGRPVRLVLERREDFLITNPSHGYLIDVEVGAAADGRFRALQARVMVDSGAFDDFTTESLAGVLVAGPYVWPSVEISAYCVLTNRVGGGAYRAPSGPPTAFAIESVVDELAGRLGMDPIAIRRVNGARPGDLMVDDEPWPAHGLDAVLDAVERAPTWQGRHELPAGEGLGFSVGYWPGSKDAAAALCRVSRDGSVQIVTGVVDMSGTSAAFQAIAAEVLGISPGDVQIVTLDTGSAPMSPGSGGSTVTYSAGRAVRLAAEDARHQLLRAASIQLEISEADLEIVEGVVRPRGTPGRGIPVGKLVRAHERAGRSPVEGHATSEHTSLAPSVAAFLAHVRVDPETGQVDLLAFDAIQDVGRALNPALITGQQHGGAAQAVGWALGESLVHDATGQMLTATFLDYSLPRAAELPEFGTAYVEVPAPDGPFGAKGIGETAVVGGPAAIANAVAAAGGVRPTELPMTASRLWRAMRDATAERSAELRD